MKILQVNFNQNQNNKNRSKSASFGMKMDELCAKYLMNEYALKWNRVTLSDNAISKVERFVVAAKRGNSHDGLRLIGWGADRDTTYATILNKRTGKTEEI